MVDFTHQAGKKTIGTPVRASFLRKSLRPLRRMVTGAQRTQKLRLARRVLCDPRDLTRDQLKAFALTKPLDEAEKRLLKRISLKVSASDYMYVDGYSTGYLTAGLSAGRVIRASLEAAGKVISGGAVLDFPCGYGRVLRVLTEMFPDSRVVGAEIDTEALKFCRRTFSVETYESSPVRRFTELCLPRKFDLIWCGSLITHLDNQAALDLLAFFCRHLAAGGVCVFTTHGASVAEEMAEKLRHAHFTDEGARKAVREYHETGYGYTDYAQADAQSSASQGISLTSPPHMLDMARSVGSWEPIYYLERGWHDLQDVYGFMLPEAAAHCG
jgi:SAM-dependent methyltransferase